MHYVFGALSMHTINREYMKDILEKCALLAEIVGAVAVVVSLVYVDLSIRQNTAAVHVANH
jgi:hypothetical protein